MLEMIRARRQSEKKEERYDLFSSLLDANEEELEPGQIRLQDSELIGIYLAEMTVRPVAKFMHGRQSLYFSISW